MRRYSIGIVLAFWCWLSPWAYGAEAVRVLILPFEIYSPEDRSQLKEDIPKVMGLQLKQEGAVVLDMQILEGIAWKEKMESLEGIRVLGVQTGADYILWGSMTWIGKKFSIDAKLMQSLGEEPPRSVYTEGEGIENLSGSITDIVKDIDSTIFHRQKVVEIRIQGNDRIEIDAIRRKIKTQPGSVFHAGDLSEDLKSIYSMGYFENIRIESEDRANGKIITFFVEEKPTIRVIRTTGNTVYDNEEIAKNLTIKTGSILNIFMIQQNVRRIEELYREKNYHNVKVSYLVHELKNRQADLEFVIKEGEKVRIKSIAFEGNSAFTDKKLKKEMKTSEKGVFSWITASGELNQENLNQDVEKIAAFYHNNGYIQAKVGEPQVEFKENWIYITMKIEEGPRFKVGTVDIEGDLILPKEELIEKIGIKKEEYYSREVVRNDSLLLSDLYSDQGYAYANISPRIDQDQEKRVVNIAYTIKKGGEVFFENIVISGNIKTRDKVIRRELSVYEQERYSGVQLKKSIRNLYRLDYFEDVKVNTVKGSSDDKMVLKIDVREKPTGFFSVGGGYSSVENLFAMGSITQRNLFGRGQTLQLKAELGGTSTRYTLSFTEPWLFDVPLSAGMDLYNWKFDYDTYDKDSVGGKVRFGYRLFDYTTAYLYYTYDVADITNIDEEEASDSIKDLEGINTTSSITAKMGYDSRDRMFNPTEGQKHGVSVEYAGGPLGGDMAFTKYLVETGWYIPLFLSTTGFLHGEAGYVQENPGGRLPDYERFYLGGMNSLRGFGSRDIHAVDEEGMEIGGDKYVQFNVEYLIPLVKKAGVVGVLFYDTGNVYNDDESIDLSDLRESAGAGVRWYSPIGPIRIEYGYILDPEDGEDTRGRWAFSMGQAF